MKCMKITFYKLFIVAVCISFSVSGFAFAEAGKNTSGTEINAIENADFQSLRSEVQRIRLDVTNASKEMKQEINRSKGILGPYGDWVSLGAMLLSAVAVGMLMLRKNKGAADTPQIHSVERGEQIRGSEQIDEVSKDDVICLQQQVEVLRDELGRLSERIQKLEADKEAKEKHTAPQSVKMMCSAGSTVSSEPYDESLADEFIATYNALYDMEDGMQQRVNDKKLKDSPFVTMFTCANHNERVVDPSIPPVFATEREGPYMAYHLGNDYYAVIPARVTYEQTRNVAYAFKEVFDSNYVEGAYTKIKVQKPAIFQGKWKLIRKGKVELSK